MTNPKIQTGSHKTFYFAGGGTGGHIYPAVAVAQKIKKIDSQSKIHFFVSSRDIDKNVLTREGFEFTILPAIGFSFKNIFRFIKLQSESRKIASAAIQKAENPVIIGVGGFVAAPVCWAAHKLGKPVALINVDIIPGKANRLIAKWANQVFVQFEDTSHLNRYKKKILVTGCPLRSSFENPNPQRAKETLGLDKNKKILLITGASSGSQNINRTISSLLEKSAAFKDKWQIVHLTGRANFDEVKASYANAAIQNKVLDYWDDMADLLASADLVIGRSGAVSVAEYAACAVPAICMPYPYHKDMHQYLNAGKLVDAGAAIIVDDVGDDADRREWLWEELEPLLKDDKTLLQMKQAAKSIGKKDAAETIANKLIAY